MVAVRHGQKRKMMSNTAVDVAHLPKRCASLVLDSGAHTLFTTHEINTFHRNKYRWYRSKECKAYLDRYAAFILANKAGLDWYANLDAIFEPDVSWRIQQYLEKEHGLNPVPVIHFGTKMRWVDHYLERGHTFLGIGGLGQEVSKDMYLAWGDRLYTHLGKGNGGKPVAKTHGFAMTSYQLMIRYPWWSVDSVSWAKAAGFGAIYVPHRRAGRFDFSTRPYSIAFSFRSKEAQKAGKHFHTLSRSEKFVVMDWLDEIGVPLGRTWGKEDDPHKAYGVRSEYNARALANALFYDRLCQWLPEWPWAFRVKPTNGFFDWEDLKK